MSAKYPIYMNTEHIKEKIENIEPKIEEIEEKVNENHTILLSLLEKTQSTECDKAEHKTLKEDISKIIENGIHPPSLIEYIKNVLVGEGLYSSENVLLKIFTNKTQDTILAVKIRPHNKIGEIISYFYNEMGEPYHFITSDYKMRVILEYNLTQWMQMPEFEDETSIVDEVNNEWDDRDNVRDALTRE